MAYQSEAELELQFIGQLNRQGYSTVSVPDYDALVENFKVQFEAFNADKLDKPLTDKEWERILNLMLGKSVFQSAKILRDKFVLEREDGTKVYLSFFDSDHTKNIFQVTHQTTVIGKYVNRYDVTILVNGLPLIQVELKRRGIDIREAVNQVMRYKKHSYNGLYHFIQIFVVSHGVDTKYFANSDREMLHSLAFFWTDFDNVRLTNLKDFSITFLARDHIIKMLTRYMILNDTDKLLMVMRPYQVYAVEALVRQATLTNRNAYVWHTTGAGKTLTSFKTAQILAANPNIKKVIFLVDRKDLDSQTTEEFNKFENGSVDATDRTDVLVKQMQDKAVASPPPHRPATRTGETAKTRGFTAKGLKYGYGIIKSLLPSLPTSTRRKVPMESHFSIATNDIPNERGGCLHGTESPIPDAHFRENRSGSQGSNPPRQLPQPE